MSRPRRTAGEAEAVKALGDSIEGSGRAKAQKVAKAVVQAYLADEAREDPMERALHEARLSLSPDPAHDIATAPDSAVADKFAKQRLARFEARGCLQLDPNAWQAETREISKNVTAQLARRYRDFLR